MRELLKTYRLAAGYALIALLLAAVAWSWLSAATRSARIRLAAREKIAAELAPLVSSYRAARTAADRQAGLAAAARPDDTPARLFEELGVKGRGLRIQPVAGEDGQEAAEVRLEAVAPSEAIGLLYRLEKGGRPVLVRKASLKVRFDDPSRFDLFLNIAMVKGGK